MNNDKIREVLKSRGINCHTVTDTELKRLRVILNKCLKESGIYDGSAKLSRAKKDLKFMEVDTKQWKRREAISFNRDGFIGIAGWADSSNVKPFRAALIEWATTTDCE